jgi:Pentapeptide repeats (8 copies)
MLNVSAASHLKHAGNASGNTGLDVEKIPSGKMTPAEILDAIRDKKNLLRLLALIEQDQNNLEGSITLGRMRALDVFGNRDLVTALQLLVHGPVERGASFRLSQAQQISFLDLIQKPECERTIRDLFEAGVMTRDDFDHPQFDYIKSDKFLLEWLKTGYVYDAEDRIHSWYPINLTHADFNRAISAASMSHDRSTVGQVDFRNCKMSGAALDRVHFYKCNFTDADLHDATIYGGGVEDCNGRRDCGHYVVRELEEMGLRGFLQSDRESD